MSPTLPYPTVTVSAPLASNTIYGAVIRVTDVSGVVSSVLSFDTITPTYTFEAEDFDYSDGVNAGLFFDRVGIADDRMTDADLVGTGPLPPYSFAR